MAILTLIVLTLNTVMYVYARHAIVSNNLSVRQMEPEANSTERFHSDVKWNFFARLKLNKKEIDSTIEFLIIFRLREFLCFFQRIIHVSSILILLKHFNRKRFKCLFFQLKDVRIFLLYCVYCIGFLFLFYILYSN